MAESEISKKPQLQRWLTPRLSDRDRLSFPPLYVYAWGRGDLGQLGLGDEADREVPAVVSSLAGKDIVHVSAGAFHTAFLTAEGELYMTGENDSGQLGIGDHLSRAVPARVAALDTHTVVHVACGQAHTVVVTGSGVLAAWGASDLGQLGQGSDTVQLATDVPMPHLVKGTRELRFARVAAGAGHTLALTGSGEVYSFGQGTLGALGHGNVDTCQVPTPVDSLWGLGIVQVACGEYHSAALTFDGQVYVWGWNKYGQLALGHTHNEMTPVAVGGALADKFVVQIACGGSCSLALTSDGQLFSWGQGRWGQTGQNSIQDQLSPRHVAALEGVHVIQVAAGSRHSLALSQAGEIYGWGSGDQHQLGSLDRAMQLEPRLVEGLPDDPGQQLLYVVTGGEHSMAIYRQFLKLPPDDAPRSTTSSSAEDGRHVITKDEIHAEGTGGTTESATEEVPPGTLANLEPLAMIQEAEMEGGAAVEGTDPSGASSAKSDGHPERFTRNTAPQHLGPPPKRPSWGAGGRGPGEIVERPHWAAEAEAKHGRGLKPLPERHLADLLQRARLGGLAVAELTEAILDVFSSARFLVAAFQVRRSGRQPAAPGEVFDLDITRVSEFYQGLLELYDAEVLTRLVSAATRVLEGVEKHMRRIPDARWLHVLLVLLQCPWVGDKGPGNALAVRLFAVIAKIPPSAEETLSGWLATYPPEIFGGRMVRSLLRFINSKQNAIGGSTMPPDVASAAKVLSLLHKVNEGTNKIPYSEFYSQPISEHASLGEEYLKWRHVTAQFGERQPFISFCQVPFMLTPVAKSKILQGEAHLEMSQLVQASMVQSVFGIQSSPFLILTVRREHLVADAMRQLSSHHPDLKKPLKVIFEGEEAVDEGGVTKEFFQLLVRDLFNVSFGMFTYSDDTRTFWFNANSLDSNHEFQLVGITIGLAIYNGVILDVHFPRVVYKKLMGLPLELEDLKELQPQLAAGLKELLLFEGNVAETFAQTFQVEFDYFGEIRSHELMPGGATTAVTNENRELYVKLYVDYLVEDSVKAQFEAFSQGFLQVCGGPALTLFRLEELELLVCGLPHFDFDALERVTQYDGGFSKDSAIIRWFWDIVHHMSLEDKKKLLFFTTGNDRAPISGLGALRFVIMRQGPDSDRLPTAHTCFNVLLLPEYAARAKLQERLELAIQNATGFGLQ